jgi:hypothetical protein
LPGSNNHERIRRQSLSGFGATWPALLLDSGTLITVSFMYE